MHTAWSRRPVIIASALALCSSAGCSLFYRLNTTQCETNADCEALGPTFQGRICVQKVCVVPAQTGGTGNMGGTSGDGVGGSGAETGGAGGAGGAPQCTTNSECIEKNLGSRYICKNYGCVGLLTPECPLLLPDDIELLKKEPLILGGYAPMQATNAHEGAAQINWELGLAEFNQNGGIPTRANGTARPVMALVCQDTADTDVLATGMSHLVDEVGATAMLTAIAPDRLLAAFGWTQDPAHPRSVFFLSGINATLQLANLKDQNMVWHMLGDPRGLAATTTSLLKLVEPWVNAKRQTYFAAHPTTAEDPSTTKLRVSLIYSDYPDVQDIAYLLYNIDYETEHPEYMLRFNGNTRALDQPEAFQTALIQSGLLHPNTTENPNDPVVDAALTNIRDFKPHVIISMATTEFPTKVMLPVEAYWSTDYGKGQNRPRPFYILSPVNVAQGPFLIDRLASIYYSNGTEIIADRMVGINFAETQDNRSRDLRTAYLSRLQTAYSSQFSEGWLASSENFYDQIYYLLYSAAAAGAPTPGATQVRDGFMSRVIAEEGTSVNVGPTEIKTKVGTLLDDLNYQMALWGTMGAPNFNRVSGTRYSKTSAWCIEKVGTTWALQSDALLYDYDQKSGASGTFVQPSGTAGSGGASGGGGAAGAAGAGGSGATGPTCFNRFMTGS